jgi:hypothetical protein
MKLVPAAALAIACTATTLIAQTPTPVPAPATTQPMTQTQTPVTAPAMTAPSAQSSAGDTDHGTAIVLLDRIQKVLDTAVDEKKSKDGPISIDRGLIDEMRAELTQVKMTLQGEKNQGEKK